MRAMKVYDHLTKGVQEGIQDNLRQLDDGVNAFGLTDEQVVDPKLLAMLIAHTREDVAMQLGATGITIWQNTMIARGIWALVILQLASFFI